MPEIVKKQLLTETRTISRNNITILNENDAQRKDGILRFKVKLLDCDIPGKNNRQYSLSAIKSLLPELQQKQKNRELIGELDHPSGDDDRFASIYVKEQSHLISDLYLDGTSLYGVIETLNTPNGRLVRDLLLQNVVLGLSLRGFGELVESKSVDSNGYPIYEVQSLEILTWDIVSNPSYESTNFTISNLIENYIKKPHNIQTLVEQVSNILQNKYKINLSHYNINLNEIVESVLHTLKEQETKNVFTKNTIDNIIEYLDSYKQTFNNNVFSYKMRQKLIQVLDTIQESAVDEFIKIFRYDIDKKLEESLYANFVNNKNMDEQFVSDIQQNLMFSYDILLSDLETEILPSFVNTEITDTLYSKLKEILLTAFNNQLLFQNLSEEDYKQLQINNMYEKLIKFAKDVFNILRDKYSNIEEFENRYGKYSNFKEVKQQILDKVKNQDQKIINILDQYIQQQNIDLVQNLLESIFNV